MTACPCRGCFINMNSIRRTENKLLQTWQMFWGDHGCWELEAPQWQQTSWAFWKQVSIINGVEADAGKLCESWDNTGVCQWNRFSEPPQNIRWYKLLHISYSDNTASRHLGTGPRYSVESLLQHLAAVIRDKLWWTRTSIFLSSQGIYTCMLWPLRVCDVTQFPI